MWITIIILAYVANVFLNRWLNKIYWKQDNNNKVLPWSWFFSLFNTAVLLYLIVDKSFEHINWFTGKYWQYGNSIFSISALA